MAFSFKTMSNVDQMGHIETPTTAFIKKFTDTMNAHEQSETMGVLNKIHSKECKKMVSSSTKKNKVKDENAPPKPQSQKVLDWHAKARAAMVSSGQAKDEKGNLLWTYDAKTKEKKPKYNKTYRDCLVELGQKNKDVEESDDEAPIAAKSKTTSKSAASKKKTVTIDGDDDDGVDVITTKTKALSMNTIAPGGAGGPVSGTIRGRGRAAPPPPPPPPAYESESEYEEEALTKVQMNGRFYYRSTEGETWLCNSDNTRGSWVGIYNPKTKKHDPADEPECY